MATKKFKMKQGKIIVISGSEVPGFQVKEIKGLVWAQTVVSKSILKEIVGALRSLIGGEIPEFTNMLQSAREVALDQLQNNATNMGANAVLSVDFDTSSPFPGTVDVMAYGTAVVLEKVK